MAAPLADLAAGDRTVCDVELGLDDPERERPPREGHEGGGDGGGGGGGGGGSAKDDDGDDGAAARGGGVAAASLTEPDTSLPTRSASSTLEKYAHYTNSELSDTEATSVSAYDSDASLDDDDGGYHPHPHVAGGTRRVTTRGSRPPTAATPKCPASAADAAPFRSSTATWSRRARRTCTRRSSRTTARRWTPGASTRPTIRPVAATANTRAAAATATATAATRPSRCATACGGEAGGTTTTTGDESVRGEEGVRRRFIASSPFAAVEGGDRAIVVTPEIVAAHDERR